LNLRYASGLALAVLDCLLLDLEQGRMNKANEFTWITALCDSADFAGRMLENGGDWREILPVPTVHVVRSMEENPKTYKRLAGILSFERQLKKCPDGMRMFEKLKQEDKERLRHAASDAGKKTSAAGREGMDDTGHTAAGRGKNLFVQFLFGYARRTRLPANKCISETGCIFASPQPEAKSR
jgi:hypothetical protein